MKTLSAAVCVFVVASAATLMAQAPTVSYLAPLAVTPGQAIDVTLNGAELAGVSSIWTNLPTAPTAVVLAPGIDKNGTLPASAVYRFTLPADAPLGIYGLRVATPKGVSNLRLFMVDDLPTIKETGTNKTVQTAQELALPVAVEGACEAESFDYYKFRAAAGQRLSAEVTARRAGSPLDSVLRLLDSTGRELAYSDDEDATGADSRLAYRFTADGEYFLELRDIRYAGSVQHRYRLRLGDFPLATAPFPLAGKKGTTPQVTVTGSAVSGVAPLKVAVPANVPGDRINVPVKYPNGQGSAVISLAASTLLEQVEFEPNNTLETASPIELSGAINGRFEAAHDRDYFRIDAKKGQRFLFIGRTRSLGVPSDLFLRMYDAAGAKVAEADDSGVDEGVLDYTFPADGVYRLMVEDLLNRGGPEHVYRVEIEPYKPGFTLLLDVEKKGAPEIEKFDAPRGGVFLAKVTAVRRDYKGPIALSVVGIDGCTLAGETIAADKPDTLMTVTLPTNLEPGAVRTISIVGKAKIDNADVQATASTIGALRTLFNGLPNPPNALDGSIGLGIGPVFEPFFELAAEPKAVPFAQILATASFKITAKRLNKFDDKVDLTIEGLPPGFTAKAVAIDKGKPDATIEVTGPKSLAEGLYSFQVVGSATFQNQPKKVVLADVALQVVPPLGVTLVPAGSLTAGGKQMVKIKLARLGGEKGAVKISFKNLPRGVKAPAEATIAEGQQEVDVELTAAANALLGPADLVAIATTKIKDQGISIESPAATLAIAK